MYIILKKYVLLYLQSSSCTSASVGRVLDLGPKGREFEVIFPPLLST